jgi:hypothetical protein
MPELVICNTSPLFYAAEAGRENRIDDVLIL